MTTPGSRLGHRDISTVSTFGGVTVKQNAMGGISIILHLAHDILDSYDDFITKESNVSASECEGFILTPPYPLEC